MILFFLLSSSWGGVQKEEVRERPPVQVFMSTTKSLRGEFMLNLLFLHRLIICLVPMHS